MLAALKGGKPAASMDNGHIAPFAASGAASSGNPPARKSMWSVIKKEMVKNETPMFINFTKQVMALAAQKYNEELDQLCDLFASSSHSFSSGTKLQLPSLHNQSIRSSEPTNALARASQQAAHESPVPLSPISQRSSSPSSESEDDFWKNRRKNLGGTLEREHSDESFVAMSETPPPSEPKPAPTALPVDSAPPQPPPPETPTEVVEERPRASVAKRWEPQEMKRKPIANAFKAQNTNTVTLKRSAAKPHETSKQDEDQNQAVEEAVEEAEEQAQEHDGALTARPGESDQTRTRRQSPLRVLDRMNQQDHVAISTKLALQAIIQNKPEFGQLDRDSGEKLFEKIKAGLDGILDPNAAVDGLVQHVCSIVADDWPDLAERVDLGEHNVHPWSDQAWTMEETKQPDENSDHKAVMLCNTEEINSVRDVGWHFDRIPSNGGVLISYKTHQVAHRKRTCSRCGRQVGQRSKVILCV